MRAQDPLIFKMRAPSFLPPSVLKVGLNFLACHFILLNTLVDLHPCNLSQKNRSSCKARSNQCALPECSCVECALETGKVIALSGHGLEFTCSSSES